MLWYRYSLTHILQPLARGLSIMDTMVLGEYFRRFSGLDRTISRWAAKIAIRTSRAISLRRKTLRSACQSMVKRVLSFRHLLALLFRRRLTIFRTISSRRVKQYSTFTPKGTSPRPYVSKNKRLAPRSNTKPRELKICAMFHSRFELEILPCLRAWWRSTR